MNTLNKLIFTEFLNVLLNFKLVPRPVKYIYELDFFFLLPALFEPNMIEYYSLHFLISN